MHGEDLLIDNSGNWQAIEAIRKRFPQFNIIPSLTFVIEAINPVNGSALVITTQDEEVFRVLDLIRKQEANCL